MLKFFSELKDWDVVSLHTQSKIAKVHDFLFDPRNGSVPAVIVSTKGMAGFGVGLGAGLGKKLSLLPAESILGWQDNLLFIHDEESISLPGEIVRLKELVDGHFDLIGARVVTESGGRIGAVEDYIIETKMLHIAKLVVRRQIWWFFSFQEVVPIKRVISMEPRRIVIKDDEGWAKKARVKGRPAQA